MGIANKVINILVLVAAIGAAVCAFLLWQKREQITKGREMLSEAIVKTVDRIGPTGQVKKDSMSVKLKADQLKEPIDVLQKNIEKICKQRDEIAKSFADVVNSVNSLSSSMEAKAQVEAAELTDYDKYGAKSEESVALVTERVNYYKERSKVIRNGVRELSAALELSGITDDKNFWDNGKLGKNFSEQAKRAADFSARFHKYSEHIVTATVKLQKALGADAKLKKPALGLNNANWQKELAANKEGISAAVNKIIELRGAVEKLKTENEALKKQLSEKEALLKEKDKEIAGLTKNLADAKVEIKRLKKIIDPSSDEGEEETAAKSSQETDFATVKKLVGKITYVNPTYGFVAIDLGSKSTIKITGLNGKQTSRIVPLPANALMTVATSLEPGDAKYVARISVAKIGADSSVANVLPLPGGTAPKVGDIVFFSDSDIRQMMEIREVEKKQAAEAAAREKIREATSAIDGEDAKGDSKSDEESEGKEDKAKGSSSSSASESDDEE